MSDAVLLSDIKLNIVMLSVIMQCIIILSALAPVKNLVWSPHQCWHGYFQNKLSYFSVAVDYKRKLFMKFVPDDGYPEIKSEEQMLVKK